MAHGAANITEHMKRLCIKKVTNPCLLAFKFCHHSSNYTVYISINRNTYCRNYIYISMLIEYDRCIPWFDGHPVRSTMSFQGQRPPTTHPPPAGGRPPGTSLADSHMPSYPNPLLDGSKDEDLMLFLHLFRSFSIFTCGRHPSSQSNK